MTTLHLTSDLHDPATTHGITTLAAALAAINTTLVTTPTPAPDLAITRDPSLPPGAFAVTHHGTTTNLHASDGPGAMYLLLDLAEQTRHQQRWQRPAPQRVLPHYPWRAMKLNLPWFSYRKHEALQVHDAAMQRHDFWADLIDALAADRYNVLTLWSMHPWHLMVRLPDFPDANDLPPQEFARWQNLWHFIFNRAHDRGMRTFILTWNIFVSPALAKSRNWATYSIDWDYFGEGDTRDEVLAYNRQSITAALNEYPNLTGIGICQSERMGGMLPHERLDWLHQAMIQGMRIANRPAQLIFRVPHSMDRFSGGSTSGPVEQHFRSVLNSLSDFPSPVYVESKFNWSHGHSTPRLAMIHGGAMTDALTNPPPDNYLFIWTVRNEDMFQLRWANPDYIRDWIAHNSQPYVAGANIGAECCIPAQPFLESPSPHAWWKWEFQRQWPLMRAWGRLLHDPSTPDDHLARYLDLHYGHGSAQLLPALARGSRMPLRLAAFFRSTWDFTLYAEGFLAPRQTPSRFITILDLAGPHPTLDPTWLSVDEFTAAEAANALPPGKLTPAQLADDLEADARAIAQTLSTLADLPPTAAPLLVDCRAWAALSRYFAHALRAAIDLSRVRRASPAASPESTLAHTRHAIAAWDDLCAITSPQYPPVPVPLPHIPDHPTTWSTWRDVVHAQFDHVRDALNTP